MKTTTFELELPRNMRLMARAAFYALEGEGCLFEHKGKLVMTDESLELEVTEGGSGGPRWVGDSFAELEDWLVECAADWMGDGPESPMFKALEQACKRLR